VQALEDCACLVFVEQRLSRFRAEQSSDTVERVLGKTWQKMSPRAQALAQALVDA